MGVQRNKAYTDEELTGGLEKGSDEVIRYLYAKNLGPISHMLYHFPHILLDVDDVLQEGLSRLILNIREGRFSGKSSVNTYLYSICRNICLKEQDRSGKRMQAVEEDAAIRNQTRLATVEEEEEDGYFARIEQVLEAKNQLEKPCVDIIDKRFGLTSADRLATRGRLDLTDRMEPDPETLHRNGEKKERLRPFEKIAAELGISHDNARQRFKRCMDKLIRVLKNTTTSLK